MMSRPLGLGGIATVIACIIVWVWLSQDDAPSDALTRDVPVAADTATDRADESAPAGGVYEDVAPTTVTTSSLPQQEVLAPTAVLGPKVPASAKEAQSPLEKYLSGRDRDARGLLQAFRTSKHRDYLEEALERFPDDPMVLLHCVLYDTEPTEERKATLLKLQNLLPDDAVPRYLLGEQLLQEGDNAGALKLLMAGSLKPHANNYAHEMISDNQAFLEASGVSPVDALAQASFNVELRLLTPMRNLLSLVQDIHADISADRDGDATARDWAIVGSRLAQSMQSQMSQTLVEELSIIGSEKKFLARLQPDTELVAGGMTVDQRTTDIAELHALVRTLPLMSSDALTLPPEEKVLFFTKLRQEGELSAVLWLNGRRRRKGNESPNK